MEQHPDTPSTAARARVWSLWLAIGVLVTAAVLGAVFIIVGDQAAVSGRAWLTLFLAAAFAGVVILDASVGTGPNRWYLPASISVNSLLLVVGLLKIWGGFFQPDDTGAARVWSTQFFLFVWVVILLRVALLITQTYGRRFVVRATKQLTNAFAALALVFLWGTTLVLSLPAALPEANWPDLWWRYVGASALVTVVLLLVPVVLLAFEPRAPRPRPVVVPPPGYGYPGAPGQTPGPYSGVPAQFPEPAGYPAPAPVGVPGVETVVPPHPDASPGVR